MHTLRRETVSDEENESQISAEQYAVKYWMR